MISPEQRKRRAYLVSAHTWANDALMSLDQCTILADEAEFEVSAYRLAFTRKFLTDLIDGLHSEYMK